MKCVCGYNDISLNKENSIRIVNEKFIFISTLKEEPLFRGDRMKECHIWACPKCGTLKVYI